MSSSSRFSIARLWSADPRRARVERIEQPRLIRADASTQPELLGAIVRMFEVSSAFLLAGIAGGLLFVIAKSPSLYPDSGTALSISLTLANGSFDTVWSTQSPLLQDGVYALMLRAGLGDYVGYPVALASLGLAGLLGLIVHRVTGSALATGLPIIVLAGSDLFWSQSGYLPFYPVAALLGYAGLYLLVLFIVKGGSAFECLLGGLALAASVYAFTSAMAFFAAPAIVCACYFSRDVLKRTMLAYAAAGALAAPWLIWHLMVGGISRIHYHPLNWFGIKYLPIVNEQFWEYPQRSPVEYARIMGQVGLTDVMAPLFLCLALPGIVYVRQRLGLRAAAAVSLSIAAYLLLLLVTRPAPFARYYYPVLPLLVLLSSGGIMLVANAASQFIPPGKPALMARLLAAAAMGVAAVSPLVSLAPGAVASAQFRYVERLPTSTGYQDFRVIAEMVEASEGGVIARDSALQVLIPENQMFTHYMLNEQDYVTFLAWPDDEAVAAMFERRDIEWVLLRNDLRWERDYHVWLDVAYGIEPRHYAEVARSPYFEHAFTGRAYTLYRFTGEPTARSR